MRRRSRYKFFFFLIAEFFSLLILFRFYVIVHSIAKEILRGKSGPPFGCFDPSSLTHANSDNLLRLLLLMMLT